MRFLTIGGAGVIGTLIAALVGMGAGFAFLVGMIWGGAIAMAAIRDSAL